MSYEKLTISHTLKFGLKEAFRGDYGVYDIFVVDGVGVDHLFFLTSKRR